MKNLRDFSLPSAPWNDRLKVFRNLLNGTGHHEVADCYAAGTCFLNGAFHSADENFIQVSISQSTGLRGKDRLCAEYKPLTKQQGSRQDSRDALRLSARTGLESASRHPTGIWYSAFTPCHAGRREVSSGGRIFRHAQDDSSCCRQGVGARSRVKNFYWRFHEREGCLRVCRPEYREGCRYPVH